MSKVHQVQNHLNIIPSPKLNKFVIITAKIFINYVIHLKFIVDPFNLSLLLHPIFFS